MLKDFFACSFCVAVVADTDGVYSKNVNCDQVLLLYRTLYVDFAEEVLTEIMLWLPVRQGDTQELAQFVALCVWYVWLKSDSNNCTLHQDRYVCGNIWLNSSYSENASEKKKLFTKPKRNSFPKNLFRISCRLWDNDKNVVQPDRPKKVIQ